MLLKLHDGLTDTRRRGIRNDWRRSFCRFMRWNQTAAISRVDTRDALIILRDGASLRSNDLSREALADLLRSSLTIGVSAVDRYVHERVVKNVVKALKRSNLNSSQRDFSIPAALTIRLAGTIARGKNSVQRGRRRRQVRPANEIRKAIQELLHRRPLQNWREIQQAFELICARRRSCSP